ncbi:MAG: Tex-like N-terminal domain-containing protein, partial [Eggerthellaceae bacterium]
VIGLIDEGNTIPFIARYRKEATGGVDDATLRDLDERLTYLRNLEARKEEVLRSIDEQGKLTADLRAKIEAATVMQRVEDLYKPYRKKRATRASKARDAGLEPLALLILAQGAAPRTRWPGRRPREREQIPTPRMRCRAPGHRGRGHRRRR